MSAHIHPMPLVLGPAYIRKGRVTQVTDDPNPIYRVRLEEQGEITARLAMPTAVPLASGDQVLVAGENAATGYIIGILESAPPIAIRTPGGAGARVQGRGKECAIAVHDADNRTVFEYYPADGRCVIQAARGDLRLTAPNGCIDLEASRGVRCRSDGEVALRSGRAVSITAQGEGGGPDQSLQMDGNGARLGVHKMTVTAGEGDISVTRAAYRGRNLQSTVDRARLVYGRLETRARQMWQNSGYLFRQVQHLCQMQAGRMRTLVKGAHHTQSQRATLIAREDVRIDGEKINLG